MYRPARFVERPGGDLHDVTEEITTPIEIPPHHPGD